MDTADKPLQVDKMDNLSFVDKIILEVDHSIKAIFSTPNVKNPNPAEHIPEAKLSSAEKTQVGGLMRINVAGEVCAQALYKSQALLSSSEKIKAQMQKAAFEEEDHLAWCNQRLCELEQKKSMLNIFWYWGAWSIGVIAGLAGEKYNLGFVAETEDQVSAHLKSHLDILPKKDQKTRALLSKMQADEEEHSKLAKAAGAAELPLYIKYLMKISSKCMTSISYYF